MECDYAYEARCQSRFKVLVESDADFAAVFNVPAVVPELSTERVLTTELVHGVHIDQARCLASRHVACVRLHACGHHLLITSSAHGREVMTASAGQGHGRGCEEHGGD